ncbi:hypothetical protein QT974_22705 [Microcoleus sp. herbarium12]
MLAYKIPGSFTNLVAYFGNEAIIYQHLLKNILRNHWRYTQFKEAKMLAVVKQQSIKVLVEELGLGSFGVFSTIFGWDWEQKRSLANIESS